MSAILEIPEVRQRVSRLSVEEYHRLDEFNEQGRRTELIRGIVIEKMSKSPLHSSVAKRLYDRIAAILPAGLVLRREDPLTLADSEPEPDIAVVRGAEADYLEAHPTTAELVIEVTVSSPTLDRENASLYAEARVTEYWIVLAPERRVEVYRRPENGRYQEMRPVGPDDPLESASLALSRRLRELRLQRHLTQTRAALLLKTSQSRLARMEAGDPSVSLDLLIRGLFALGATWKELARAA